MLVRPFFLFLLTDIIVPTCPIGLEYFIYGVLDLSTFNFYEKSLVVSAMMVPLVGFVKTSPDATVQRVMFGMATLLGLMLLVIVLLLTAQKVTVEATLKAYALSICYSSSFGIVILATIGLLLINFLTCIIYPVLRRKKP